jgi:hypothetical protein
MTKDVSFALDPKGGEEILQGMMMATVKQKADAIAARAAAMAGSMSNKPPSISVTTRIGTIKRGIRAIATISAEGDDAHQNYIGHYVLARAKDAGRG